MCLVAADPDSFREVRCGRCEAVFYMCRDCDTGQVYCPGTCSVIAASMRCQKADRQYRGTFKGARTRAAAEARRRGRAKFVGDRAQQEVAPAGTVCVGFRLPRDAFAAFLTHLHKSRVGPTETLEQLAELEERARDTVNLARRTRSACLGTCKPLDRFDWAHPRAIDRPLIERLMTLDFVERAANVLVKGGSGVGKTMIAQNLGLAGLAAGYTVRFASLATALADLLNQESLPAFERRVRRYTDPDVLILDELGYLPCDSRAADMLYNIVSRRHEKRSTIITTNLAFKQWGAVFPGAACVVALVDRFNQHCHRLTIDADSWRETHGLDDTDPPPASPPSRRRRRPNRTPTAA